MTDQNNILKNMVIKLVACETENEVVQVLTEEGYWNTNDGIWQPYGGVENNSGQIQAQSSDSTSALVEKLTNSGDSLLMLEAYKRGIDPKSNEAPQTMRSALKEFFGYPNGSINEVGKDVIQKNSNNIGLITTGNKSNPSYTIFDLGIGQTPIALPKTILSLGESNKDQISFLQGVFNQGGSARQIFAVQIIDFNWLFQSNMIW